MVNWLVKTFIADYEHVEDAKVRTSYGLLSSVVGIGCNLTLFTAKLLIGLLTHSISVMADAFNNLSDAASSIIGFVGVKLAEKPADEEHPFGHGRMEYIAAFIVAGIVIQVGLSLFQSSFMKMLHPEEMTFRAVSVVILLMSMAVKLWMASFNRKLGKRIQSTVMMATAADSMGDVLATGATVFSMVVFGIWGINLDGIVGLLVSVAVLIAGVNIAKDTLRPLIGEAVDPKLYQEITRFVESYEGIMGSHDLIVHNYGPSRSMASIHAEVPNDVDIEKSHEIIDKIEHDCMKQLGIFLVVHMDPVETQNIHRAEMKQLIEGILKQLDNRLTFHDFRVVYGQQRINLIFDLVVPREYKAQMREAVKQQVSDAVHAKNDQYWCVITVESSYCAEHTNQESLMED